MKVLIVGSGAREHALAWKFSTSKRISALYIAPGNAGTDELGENIPDLDPADPAAITEAAVSRKVTHVVIGPEVSLAAGVADSLKNAGISVIGPERIPARLEASKQFSKSFMLRNKVPTAACVEITDPEQLKKELSSRSSGKVVLKKSGLAAGKGVLESDDPKELQAFGEEILKEDTLILEEFLTGFEVSIFALLDGKNYLLLPPCADFKKAGIDDSGPNTGGMGAICPVPTVSNGLLTEIEERVVRPTMQGLAAEDLMYTGVLYFGLMITESGPKVLEYNVRFGDPEAQVLLPLIESDIGNLVDAMAKGKLDEFPLRISEKSALGIVVASGGYPGAYQKGVSIDSLPRDSEKDSVLFHASTTMGSDGKVLTGGGRCFTVVGLGSSLLSARAKAYALVSEVQFQGAWYRPDIGKKFFAEN
ncbi:phosphoribosylamine--glycine ligase [Marispirochaeta sp.]|uniref:phosphoribosylamine--glycine ligase n=1 Tax=Marispirochaeta sp. TaxID=2038653 RepID=UPI0029C7B74E|nr:phosphoribosylamine--glycine ligase [Marispirochaeta sp.]